MNNLERGGGGRVSPLTMGLEKHAWVDFKTGIIEWASIASRH